jgi:hypothetical protein
MAQVKFFRVATLPGTLEANSFYYVGGSGPYAESYVTDSSGAAKAIGNSVMINALIDAKLEDLTINTASVVADITARDALTASATSNLMILVLDATGDSTVDAGAALYIWDNDTTTIHKIAEYESIDLEFTWAALTGKPSSDVADIDEAVSQRHTHSNKSTLDLIGQDDDTMTFNGEPVSGTGAPTWGTTDW